MIEREKALEEIQRRAVTEDYWRWKPLPQSQGQQRFIQRMLSVADDEMPTGTHVLIGGNRSGKTDTGAFAVARLSVHNLSIIAKKFNETPLVWVVGQRLEDCGEIQWKQKLKRLIPEREIDQDGISWRNKAMDHPAMIRLRSGVEIHFKAAEQGRKAFQRTAIRLVWQDEQMPADVAGETDVRCIDLKAPKIKTLTPIDPDPYLEVKYNDPPKGWIFEEISIDDNRKSRGGYLDDEEVDRMIEEWPEELVETRRHGKFAGFDGLIYQSFRRSLHVLPDKDEPVFQTLSHDAPRYLGVDFGVSAPFAAVWLTRTHDGVWVAYDEHFRARQPIETHIQTIRAKMLEHGANNRNAAPEHIQGVYADT